MLPREFSIEKKPERIQRRRTRGWRMPPGAIYVGRPTKWGNPYWHGEKWHGGDRALALFDQMARDAARDAASAAARAAAWAAARAAARDAWDAARDAAGDAARDAADKSLAPAVTELQASAQDLVRRMCAVGR